MANVFELPIEISQEIIHNVYEQLGQAIHHLAVTEAEIAKLQAFIKASKASDPLSSLIAEGKNETARDAIARSHLVDEYNRMAELEVTQRDQKMQLDLVRVRQSYILDVIRFTETLAINAPQ